MLSPALSCGRHLNSFRTSSAVKEPFLLSRGVHRVVADRLFALRGICPASRARWAQMLCEKPFFSRSVRFIFLTLMWMGI